MRDEKVKIFEKKIEKLTHEIEIINKEKDLLMKKQGKESDEIEKIYE